MWDKIEKLAYLIFAVALLTVAGMGISKQSSPARIVVENTQTPEKIRVAVEGAVNEPGEYVLDKGSRICDLLYAAGGVCEDADLDVVKPDAQLISDTTVKVPYISNDTGKAVAVININDADKEELMLIPGIGDYLADKIIEYRKKYGSFGKVSDITKVDGIGEKTYKNIKIYITTDNK